MKEIYDRNHAGFGFDYDRDCGVPTWTSHFAPNLQLSCALMTRIDGVHIGDRCLEYLHDQGRYRFLLSLNFALIEVFSQMAMKQMHDRNHAGCGLVYDRDHAVPTCTFYFAPISLLSCASRIVEAYPGDCSRDYDHDRYRFLL